MSTADAIYTIIIVLYCTSFHAPLSTAVLGVGQPAEENFSFVVILVIIVGFGVPGAVVLLGVVFIVAQKFVWRPLRKLHRRKTGYAPL